MESQALLKDLMTKETPKLHNISMSQAKTFKTHKIPLKILNSKQIDLTI